jgi:hypothetical protein
MPSVREWIRHPHERRANRRAFDKERAGRSPGEGQEIGYNAVCGGSKSTSGTSGTGGV